MKKSLFLFYVLFNLVILSLSAQDNLLLISGKVIDNQTQEPLVGVTVQIKGTISGVITDGKGAFALKTKLKFPLTLVFSSVGYAPQEYVVKTLEDKINVQLETQTMLGQEVVVTASRVEETVMKSPVAIEKLDLRAIKETPAPSFFDAIESVKGVQMTTLSLGFKVPNTRGFGNTTNPRFLQLVDGADTQAPGLGVSIANTVGPTELDVESIEVTPGASSALYGMNALNGISNVITKSPFYYQGLSVYQKVGINHINDPDYSVRPFTETAIRYAKAINDKFAFKVNIGYLKGTDWVANNSYDLNATANSSTGLLGADNPGKDPLNSYGNESSNRKTLTLADGKRYEVRRTGYYEKDLVNDDYNVSNLKADAAIHYKFTEKLEASYSYRIGVSDAIYQRGNRIRLDDYRIQQHKVYLRGTNYFFRAYLTQEYTDKSYNIRPMGENIDRAFKTDAKWFSEYQSKYNELYNGGVSVTNAHQQARAFADAGRYEPGTKAYNDKLHELTYINNWDIGAQLLMNHKFYHLEGQYDFAGKITWIDLLVGADFRDFLITPEGNSFINPDKNDPLGILHYNKVGGFVQATKYLLNKNLKLVASARLDKAQYFKAKLNPRIAAVYTLKEKHNFRISFQNGYRFPTLFEGFSTVNNGGVIRYGGLSMLTNGLFENSYLRSSVDAFQKAITNDVNQNGKTQDQAILDNKDLLVRNTYTYLQPEQIEAFDIGYKASLFNDKVFLDVDGYYNIYNNFIDQVEIVVPNTTKIDDQAEGVSPAIYEAADNTKQTRYRMWTNAKNTYYNYGASLGITYNFFRKFTFTGNYSYAKLAKVDRKDSGLETSFNTPQDIVNLSIGNREIAKNLGFNIAWRWQSSFAWQAPLGNGTVPSYYTFDGQITYRLPAIKSQIKIGGSNLLNKRYFQYFGGPTIGAFYYTTITVDGLLQK
ncbi:TonB-dependent receptor [Xanthocytophaga agilis]|uniref:TonB-dependent receptor n=1 Tax=Xanthocytophaga agilis TaxID=3048010 RepID=A0AAE3UE12_9BACT|nr:TonB-dependent receptor [Xanthocytophaga agilis]MDJ1502453.1 TonB-dependent receptor [Xanthocytophaga agilis]